jgi:hypothetical protein
MKNFALISGTLIIMLFLIISLDHMDRKFKDAQMDMLKRAYFIGQKDYAEGRIRIVKTNGHWSWRHHIWKIELPSYESMKGYK